MTIYAVQEYSDSFIQYLCQYTGCPGTFASKSEIPNFELPHYPMFGSFAKVSLAMLCSHPGLDPSELRCLTGTILRNDVVVKPFGNITPLASTPSLKLPNGSSSPLLPLTAMSPRGAVVGAAAAGVAALLHGTDAAAIAGIAASGGAGQCNAGGQTAAGGSGRGRPPAVFPVQLLPALVAHVHESRIKLDQMVAGFMEVHGAAAAAAGLRLSKARVKEKIQEIATKTMVNRCPLYRVNEEVRAAVAGGDTAEAAVAAAGGGGGGGALGGTAAQQQQQQLTSLAAIGTEPAATAAIAASVAAVAEGAASIQQHQLGGVPMEVDAAVGAVAATTPPPSGATTAAAGGGDRGGGHAGTEAGAVATAAAAAATAGAGVVVKQEPGEVGKSTAKRQRSLGSASGGLDRWLKKGAAAAAAAGGAGKLTSDATAGAGVSSVQQQQQPQVQAEPMQVDLTDDEGPTAAAAPGGEAAPIPGGGLSADSGPALGRAFPAMTSEAAPGSVAMDLSAGMSTPKGKKARNGGQGEEGGAGGAGAAGTGAGSGALPLLTPPSEVVGGRGGKPYSPVPFKIGGCVDSGGKAAAVGAGVAGKERSCGLKAASGNGTDTQHHDQQSKQQQVAGDVAGAVATTAGSSGAAGVAATAAAAGGDVGTALASSAPAAAAIEKAAPSAAQQRRSPAPTSSSSSYGWQMQADGSCTWVNPPAPQLQQGATEDAAPLPDAAFWDQLVGQGHGAKK